VIGLVSDSDRAHEIDWTHDLDAVRFHDDIAAA